MFTCYVNYVVLKKEDIIKVIDELSVFGTINVYSKSDVEGYQVSQFSNSNAIERHMGVIRIMISKGVSIRNVTVGFTENGTGA